MWEEGNGNYPKEDTEKGAKMSLSFRNFSYGFIRDADQILSSFTHSSVITNMCVYFFCWTQKKICWRIWVTKQLMVPIDFIEWKKIPWKSKGTNNFIQISSFVFNRRNKLIQGWGNLWVSKWWKNLHFGVNYPFYLYIEVYFFYLLKKFSFIHLLTLCSCAYILWRSFCDFFK